MRLFFLFLTLFGLSTPARSQTMLEVNIYRVAKPIGLIAGEAYGLQWSSLTALRLVQPIGEVTRFNLGVRRIADRARLRRAMTQEETRLRGFEVNMGLERSLELNARWSLLLELGVFFERSTLIGTFSTSLVGENNIHHRRHYYGIYPELKAAYRIIDGVALVAGSRLRFGTEVLRPLEISSWPYTRSPHGSFELFSTVAIRIRV